MKQRKFYSQPKLDITKIRNSSKDASLIPDEGPWKRRILLYRLEF